jgi:prophage regulatory protein
MNDNEKPTMDDLRPMLSFKQVLSMIPLSRSTILRKSKDGTFPKPRNLAPMKLGWYLDEIVAWQKALDKAA